MKDAQRQTLVQYRLERADSALQDARSLLETGGSVEGIVNRSYYAMFYAVLALLQHMDKLPRKHSGIIGLFDREFYKTGIFSKDMSKDLHRSFELRQKSDYQDLVLITRSIAEELFTKASSFVCAIKDYAVKNLIAVK